MPAPRPVSSIWRCCAGEAYTKGHKGTEHLWKMENIAKNMMAEIKSGAYPERGVTALSACRHVPIYPDRPDKWW